MGPSVGLLNSIRTAVGFQTVTLRRLSRSFLRFFAAFGTAVQRAFDEYILRTDPFVLRTSLVLPFLPSFPPVSDLLA